MKPNPKCRSIWEENIDTLGNVTYAVAVMALPLRFHYVEGGKLRNKVCLV